MPAELPDPAGLLRQIEGNVPQAQRARSLLTRRLWKAYRQPSPQAQQQFLTEFGQSPEGKNPPGTALAPYLKGQSEFPPPSLPGHILVKAVELMIKNGLAQKGADLPKPTELPDPAKLLKQIEGGSAQAQRARSLLARQLWKAFSKADLAAQEKQNFLTELGPSIKGSGGGAALTTYLGKPTEVPPPSPPPPADVLVEAVQWTINKGLARPVAAAAGGGGTLTTNQQNVLKARVEKAIKFMKQEVNQVKGQEALKYVFGDGLSAVLATTLLNKAGKQLETFHNDGKIIYNDKSSDEVATGDATGIYVGPLLFEGGSRAEKYACIVLVHESTHTLPGVEKTLDLMYMNQPGFEEADAVKLKNAAHFEEVARQYFGIKKVGSQEVEDDNYRRTFTPKVNVMALASHLISVAWVQANRVADLVQHLNTSNVKTVIQDSYKQHGADKHDVHRVTILMSRLLGLTMHKHKKLVVTKGALGSRPQMGEWKEGYDVDVREAYERTNRLGNYMRVIKEHEGVVQQAVGNTGGAKVKVRAALRKVIELGGSIRNDVKDPDKTLLMIEALAELYLHSESQFALPTNASPLEQFAYDEMKSATTLDQKALQMLQTLSDRLYNAVLGDTNKSPMRDTFTKL
jgi:hypothetical protein